MTQYADGTHRMRYIGLFENNKSMLAITLNRDGNIFWNTIYIKQKQMNKSRVGWLLYAK